MDFADKPQQKKKGFGLRHKRRVAIRIDMTPMVDIAFLLLIFFMVTTVFRKPQAMEVNLPPADTKVQVAESNVLTLYVTPDNGFYWRMGTGGVSTTSMKDLRTLFTENAKLNPELIILVKVDRAAKYKTMVDVMDELELANMSRFSLIPLGPEDIKVLESAS
ncbi:MAG: biopolymer transporter ExbD [Candidatus Eisenbacteria bacterium]|nr:biopolymer transporter ExbD [Candidatus Eisenbacteria bacterium]